MAILVVLLYHFVSLAPPSQPYSLAHYLQSAFQMGWAGVDLFFVLSGFLIGGILLDSKESPRYFSTFYLRRVHRIFPLYYCWIVLYFLIAFSPLVRWAVPLGIVRDKWTIIPVYGFFLENLAWSRGPAFKTGWLASLWSLAVEEQFYLVMPSVVRFLPKRGLITTLFAVILGSPFVRILVYKYISPSHGAATYMLTPCRADALAIGVLAAVVWRDDRWKQLLQNHLSWLLTALGILFAGIIYLNLIGETQYGFAMTVWGYTCLDTFFAGLLMLALVAPGGIWATVCRWHFLIELGGISYCVYIIHTSVNEFVHFAFSSPLEGISSFRSLAATLVAAGLIWLIAKISWRFVEHPMIRRGHRYKY